MQMPNEVPEAGRQPDAHCEAGCCGREKQLPPAAPCMGLPATQPCLQPHHALLAELLLEQVRPQLQT